MAGADPRSGLVVLVFGHRRPRALRYVLEGLKRQGALCCTQVWLDGHQEDVNLTAKVEACRKLEHRFPEASWVKYGTRRGNTSLLLTALSAAVPRFDKILVLEDDCFPAEDAVDTFCVQLERTRTVPDVFSVYGHHFRYPGEEDTTTAFQCWGWAVTSDRLKPFLPELLRLWNMPEPDCVRWLAGHLTPEIRNRMDVFPGRSGSRILSRRFSWSSVMAFLVARAGMVNQRTPKQVVFNFGMGQDAGHFSEPGRRLLEPPFNIVPESVLVERFNLSEIIDAGECEVNKGTSYTFGTDGNGLRLLGAGWSIPDQTATWSDGGRSTVHMSMAEAPSSPVELCFKLRGYSPGKYPLVLEVQVDGIELSAWRLRRSLLRYTSRRLATSVLVRHLHIPARYWSPGVPTTITFRLTGAVSSPATEHSCTPGVSDPKPSLGLLRLDVR